MSIIGVRGVPIKVKLQILIRKLAHVVKCQFEAFENQSKTSVKYGLKTYYLKLPQRIDPFETINIINSAKFPYQLEAFMPSNDSIQVPNNTKKVPQALRKSLNIPPNFTSKEMIQRTHKQIMIEMLSKFPHLHELSKTNEHQLLHTLSQILYLRLENIQTSKQAESCFNLSKFYRFTHSHSKDFEFIKDVFIKIQKSKGIAFEDINEKEFCLYNPEDVGDSSIIGNSNVESISVTYSDRIVDRVMDHIQNFSKDINQLDPVRAEVREHINNLAPLIPTIIRKVIRNKLITKTFSHDFEVLRIYGEPFLPNRDRMNPFLKKFNYTNVQRSEDIFNLITVKIPVTNYMMLLKCDGTVVSGARLVIRPLAANTHLEQLQEISLKKPEANINIEEYCI